MRGRRTVLAAGLLALAAGCGQQSAPPSTSPDPRALDASAAVERARADLLAGCSREARAVPGPEAVDEGWAAEMEFTTERAVLFLREQREAFALDAWARCTLPDAYAGFRVNEQDVIEGGAPYGAVLSVTAAAGPDPLAGAPLDLLAGHVEVERVPFSHLQLVALADRVDRVLAACDDLPDVARPSAMIDLDGYTLVSSDGDAVEGCLDAADERGELGRDPGRAQVRVEDLGSDVSVVDGPVIVKTGSQGAYEDSATFGRVELVEGCLLLVDDATGPFGASVLVWDEGTTWDGERQEVVLADGVRVPLGTRVLAAGATESDLRNVLGPEGERAAVACGGSGTPADGGLAVRAGSRPEGEPYPGP
ncbi:hypothetical protein [Kineococcus terrestris]|uniref:hypothetical protein n=1 Tax=Kineococcus terrestris TaxID=2044856 RepID=UPI0034DAD66D